MSELIPIVNTNDEIIWYKEREEITPEDIYRVSTLWIENSKGEILLAQRGFLKRNSPGKWGPAVVWTVEKGESYEENVVKEAFEELGIKVEKIDFSVKFFIEEPKHYFFCSYYTIVIDADISEFVIEYPQVESIRWFSREELAYLLKNAPEILVGEKFMKYKLWI